MIVSTFALLGIDSGFTAMSSGVRVPLEFAVHTLLDYFPIESPTDKDSCTKPVYKCIRPCAANSEANYSQHYVRNPCTILRSEFFKRVILCFLSCEVCHALTCFIPCYDRLHSLQCMHRRMLRSDWSTLPLQRSTFPCTTLR